jgi:hypothetical protein
VSGWIHCKELGVLQERYFVVYEYDATSTVIGSATGIPLVRFLVSRSNGAYWFTAVSHLNDQGMCPKIKIIINIIIIIIIITISTKTTILIHNSKGNDGISDMELCDYTTHLEPVPCSYTTASPRWKERLSDKVN